MSELPLILVLLLGWRGPRPRHLVDMTSATVDGAPDSVLLGEQALAQFKRAETLRLLAK